MSTRSSQVASLLDLPVEIRLRIYLHLFGKGKSFLHYDNLDSQSCMIPANGAFTGESRCAQLLRTCKTIAAEAQDVLYSNTTFHVMICHFAVSLPTKLSDFHPTMPYMKHIIWQLNCDILKKTYMEDLRFDKQEMSRLESLEIRCQAETWKGSYCGMWCDRENFVKGRDELLEYGKRLQEYMSGNDRWPVLMVEDQHCLGKGEVRVSLERHRKTAKDIHQTKEVIVP